MCLILSDLTESAAYPFLSITKIDVHNSPVVILKGGSNSNVSETITVQICKTAYACAKSPHGCCSHTQFTFKLHLLKNKQTKIKLIKSGNKMCSMYIFL